MNSRMSEMPVQIVMIEDDEGHARLIEKNIRRAGVNNPIMPFTNGTEALRFLFGTDGSGLVNKGKPLLVRRARPLPDTTGVDILTNFLKDGTKPAQQITLITPVAITKDNLDTAERLSEVK